MNKKQRIIELIGWTFVYGLMAVLFWIWYPVAYPMAARTPFLMCMILSLLFCFYYFAKLLNTLDFAFLLQKRNKVKK